MNGIKRTELRFRDSDTCTKHMWGDCLVCGDLATGKHYGIVACEGCKGFFKRSIRKELVYSCRGKSNCPIDKVQRNRCQRCRLDKCLLMGMKKDAVQCERKPVVKPPVTGSQVDCLKREVEAHTSSMQFLPSGDPGGMAVVNISAPLVVVPFNGACVPSQKEVATAQLYGDRVPILLPSISQGFPREDIGCPIQQIQTDISNSILSSEHLHFKLNPPTLAVSTISLDYVYELATRLLFLSVDWARSVPAFRSLQKPDQLALLQYSWSDVFLFGVAQCSNTIPLSPLLTFAATHLKCKEEGDVKQPALERKGPSMLEKIVAIKDFVFSLDRLQVDHMEYAYLRATVVFNADCPNLNQPKQVESMQERAYSALKDHAEQSQPNQPNRFAKLLLRLPATKSLNPELIEELFFAPLIGTVRIDTIMGNILSDAHNM